MDLEIKDVADLLNVSEKTIHSWLDDGKIPAYRIRIQDQDRYRFSRVEIEDWMIKQKLNKTNGFSPFDEENKETEVLKGGIKQFSFYRALHKGGVLHDISGSDKEQVILTATSFIANDLDLDHEMVTDLLLDREKQQPTALDNGVAVPHTRDLLLASRFDVVYVAFPEKPVLYGALDGQPVHTLFFLFASQDANHLHLLAKIAHLSSHSNCLEFLKTKPNKASLLDFIKEWESRILSR